MVKIDVSKYKLEDIALYNQLAGMIRDRVIENHVTKKISEEEKMDVCMGAVLEFANENNITMKNLYEALLFYFIDWLDEN